MTQYGIRLTETEMDWKEFTTLLHAIMPETPLGQMVSIRAEENKDMLKHFTPEQHSIRNAWRSKHSRLDEMTDEEKEKSVKSLQDVFAKAFG